MCCINFSFWFQCTVGFYEIVTKKESERLTARHELEQKQMQRLKELGIDFQKSNDK